MPIVQVDEMSATAITPSQPGNESEIRQRPALTTRKSSSLHQNVIKKLRPLPFQYVWAVWHDKAASSTSGNYDERLTLLAESVADIGSFYRIYNNFPWENVKIKDSIHVFRSGVRPLWEDAENLDGGCLTVKVKREDGKSIKAWEEMCLMACGGELQAAVQSEHDHILGLSYSPRLYVAHINVWNKRGENAATIKGLKEVILDRLSAEFRPAEKDVYYKKHSEHEGWQEAIKQ
ncbi:MAG: hypothetical protein Q9227_005579 [Pyrenula ochraceoflavens]